MATSKATVRASNAELMNAVRSLASTSYRERVPVATQANIAKTAALINQYQPLWNEFYTTLFDRIGLTVFNRNQFTNRLKPFKKSLNFGAVVQETSANLITAEAYNEEKNVDPWAAGKPETVTDYHVKNRADTYGIRINEQLLYEAMTNEGELSAYLNGFYALPGQSAENDEYLIMRNLFAQADNADGFFNVQVQDVANASDKTAAAQELTTAIRTMYLTTKGFYSREYNRAGVDAMARDLVLLATPAVMATNDVYSLASAYNMDKATWMADRVIVVDSFGDMQGNPQAILCDIDAFQCYDILYKSASIYNPRNDSLYNYLHARGIYSLSRQRTVIKFSTAADTAVTLNSRTASTVTVATNPASGVKLEPGAEIQLVPTVKYSTGQSDDANAYPLITTETSTGTNVVYADTGTYVDRNNVLHVSPHSTYTNLTVTYTATDTPTVTGAVTLTDGTED